MPAWTRDGRRLGVKVVTARSDNSLRGLSGVNATYLLCDGETGEHLAVIDGDELTVRRTVAVSALAAACLASETASSLLVVGAGRIARLAPEAFRAVRPIARVAVWSRTPEKAAALAAKYRADGFDAAPTASLADAVARADIVSCATFSERPLIRGEWLGRETHLDLIGSFTPTMREADTACFRDAEVFVDTPTALQESGDLTAPISAGVVDPDRVGTLAALCAGPHRRQAGVRTVFKAVGTALADLAAAALLVGDAPTPQVRRSR